MAEDYPILEFDPTPEAIIEPANCYMPIDIPEHCVFCFFNEAIKRFGQLHPMKVIREPRSGIGIHPIYEVDWQGQRIALINPRIGASIAVVDLEESIALGCRKFIACGSAGVLDGQLTHGHLIVPTSAVRDEGTSFHYAPPGRETHPSKEAVAAIQTTLDKHGVPYELGKTWTTDAFFRETPAKVARRKAEDCLTVDMEASAFFAVAKFRGVQFGQILYAADDVSGEEWDSRKRNDRVNVREKLLELAIEACLSM